MSELLFKIDSQLKTEYLSIKPRETAHSDYFVLRSADEYEESMQKELYNMNYSELNQLLVLKFKNSSSKAIAKNVSILKNYIDFCIEKNMVLHGENRLAMFTSEDIRDIVNKQALGSKYITRFELDKYKNMLYNEQDKLMLELLFIGVKGRPSQEGTLEEIINLKMSDVDKEKRRLILSQNNGKHRLLENVPASTIELIEETYNQKFYVENNGQITGNPRSPNPRETIINYFEGYVFRTPGKDRFSQLGKSMLNSRLRKIQKILDNYYITWTSIYMSGMLDMLYNLKMEKGELTKEDYNIVCNRFNYAIEDNGEGRYWSNLKTTFHEYLEVKNLI